jgi:hypothetical protein
VIGGFVEEQVSVGNSLFLTGGFRADGAGSFGKNISTPVYPKASISWLVSREPFWPAVPGISSLRLRAAYGESGVEPGPLAALSTYAYQTGLVNGQPSPGLVVQQIANNNLKPEIQHEGEVGFDLDALRDRVHLEATYYDKHSSGALIGGTAGNSLGTQNAPTFNLGSVRNWGYEGLVSIRLIDFGIATWDVTFNGSINHNQLVRLEPGVSSVLSPPGPGFQPGYPIAGYFAQPITGYDDTDGDGILSPNEVTVGPKSRFAGASYPPIQMTWGTTVSLFHNTLTAHVQVDRRTGFVIFNETQALASEFGIYRGTSDPHAPLSEQAAAVALLDDNTYWGFYQPGDFTRLREVALTYTLPSMFLWHGGQMSITLSGRNIALWSHYRPDPEVNSSVGGSTTTGAYSDFGATPVAAYWLARVNVTF